MQPKKKKTEKQLLQEGFLSNLLSGFLGYSIGKDQGKIEIKRSFFGKPNISSEREATKEQMKRDDELKRLLTKFSSSSTDLFQYVKRNRKKGGVYENLYMKLAEFY